VTKKDKNFDVDRELMLWIRQSEFFKPRGIKLILIMAVERFSIRFHACNIRSLSASWVGPHIFSLENLHETRRHWESERFQLNEALTGARAQRWLIAAGYKKYLSLTKLRVQFAKYSQRYGKISLNSKWYRHRGPRSDEIFRSHTSLVTSQRDITD